MGMLQPGGVLHLDVEAFHAQTRDQIGREKLDHDFALEELVLRDEHSRGAANSQLTGYPEAGSQGRQRRQHST